MEKVNKTEVYRVKTDVNTYSVMLRHNGIVAELASGLSRSESLKEIIEFRARMAV